MIHTNVVMEVEVGVGGGVSLSCISWWEFLSFTAVIQ